MAQQIEMNQNGLNIISIGNITDKLQVNLKPIRCHANYKQIRPWFDEDFYYYFIDSDTMFINSVGVVKEIFIAANKSNEIKGIFIFLENPKEQLLALINKSFDSAKLGSETFINSSSVWTKMFWKKNDISVFLDTQRNSSLIKISIASVLNDEERPGINIEY